MMLALVLVTAACLSAVVGRAAVASASAGFGPGDAAWEAYYASPLDRSTWSAFCAGGGATDLLTAIDVPACGPVGSTDVYGPQGSYFTAGFQCVELVERYLWVNRELAPVRTNGGHLVAAYAAASSKKLTVVKNGSGQLPTVGAVISFSDNPAFNAPDSDPGHTAVVTYVSPPNVTPRVVKIVGENQKGKAPPYTAGEATLKVVTGSNGPELQTFDGNKYMEWFNPPQWHPMTITVPNATQSTLLRSVSCPTTTFCMAVGQWGDVSQGSGFEHPLAEMWDGTKWTAATVPTPQGTDNDHLFAVSCTSPSWCMAVGTEASASFQYTFAVLWNGTSWSQVAAPHIPGGDDELNSISCLSATWCLAVGDWQNNAGTQSQNVIDVWDGTAWSLAAHPKATGALYSVSCTTTSFCMIDGLANFEWTGSAVMPVTGPIGSSVSCTSPSFCMANVSATTTAEWNESAWATINRTVPRTAYAVGFLSIDCLPDTACVAAGAYEPTQNVPVGLVEQWDGASWHVMYANGPRGTLFSDSCATPGFCVAVGESNAPGTVLAEVYE